MMKIYPWGRNITLLKDELKRRGFTVTSNAEEADLIMPYGGDGTFFSAELKWPGKLKFPMRDTFTAPVCPDHGINMQLNMLQEGTLHYVELPKLCGGANGMECHGINDVFLHNHFPASALRYSVIIDGEMYAREIVGDAVGAATPHGSTAYYRSITHNTFRTGIGLAFSNSTELVDHLVLKETSRVQIHILRGPADMLADNSPDLIHLEEGESAEIYLSELKTPVLGLDLFMCSECRRLRHTLRNTSQFFGGRP